MTAVNPFSATTTLTSSNNERPAQSPRRNHPLPQTLPPRIHPRPQHPQTSLRHRSLHDHRGPGLGQHDPGAEIAGRVPARRDRDASDSGPAEEHPGLRERDGGEEDGARGRDSGGEERGGCAEEVEGGRGGGVC